MLWELLSSPNRTVAVAILFETIISQEHQESSSLNAAERKTLKRAQDSRAAWKAKALDRNQRLRAATRRIHDLETSRPMWRERAQDAQNTPPAPPSSPPAVPEAVKRDMPWYIQTVCLNLVLTCAVSFRAVPKILTVFQELLGYCDIHLPFSIPHFTTVIRWMLRVGTYLLTVARTLTIATWVCVLDHTMQVGRKKALGILRVPLDRGAEPRALRQTDMEVVSITVKDAWNGDAVEAVLDDLFARIGPPVQVVSDSGSDLKKGLRNIVETGRFTMKITTDVTHFIANLLKTKYQDHPQFQALLTHLTATKQRLLQTALAYLVPVAVRAKSRFLNLPAIAAWTTRMLAYLRALPTTSPQKPQAREHVLAQVGWITDFREFLRTFQQEMPPLPALQHLLKTTGLTAKTYAQARQCVQQIPDDALHQPLYEYIDTERASVLQRAQVSLLTSDVLESLFRTYKHLAKPHGLSEINRMSFAIPCLWQELTPPLVREAVASQSNLAAQHICHQAIPTTLLAQRRQAFSSSVASPSTQLLPSLNAVTTPP